MKPFTASRLPEFALLVYVAACTVGAFIGGLWASLGIGFALIAFFAVWAADREPPRPDKNLALMALTALLVAALLNVHSSQPGLSWQAWIRLATIFVPLCLLFSPVIAWRGLHPKFFSILPGLLAAGGLALAGFLYVKGLHLPPHDIELAHYNRGFSYLALLAFPMMASLWNSQRRWLILPFLLLLFIPAEMTESRTTKLALLLAIPVMILAQVWPVLVRRALTLTPFLTLGWPFAARWFFREHYDFLARIPLSWRARMEIWDYISYRIMERPLFGWGLGASHTLPFDQPHGALYVITKIPAAHPHNIVLELWAELGLPGLALGIGFALLTLHKACRLDARLRPFALGAWVAAFCLCLLAYDFWTDSLFAAFALAGFAFLLLQEKLKSSRSSAVVPEVR